MLPILLGLCAAVLFGIAAGAIYGFDASMGYPWVDGTFFAVIVAGTLVTLINVAGERLRCLACALTKRFPRLSWICRTAAPCA